VIRFVDITSMNEFMWRPGSLSFNGALFSQRRSKKPETEIFVCANPSLSLPSGNWGLLHVSMNSTRYCIYLLSFTFHCKYCYKLVSMKRKDHLEDMGIDWRIILE